MLDRNRRIKSCPERFQSCYEQFDVIFTVEERVYDQVVEGKLMIILLIKIIESIELNSELSMRTPIDNTPVHIINIDVQDNHEEATIGAFLLYEMAQLMSQSEDLDNDIDELLQEFETKAERPILHTIAFQ